VFGNNFEKQLSQKSNSKNRVQADSVFLLKNKSLYNKEIKINPHLSSCLAHILLE